MTHTLPDVPQCASFPPEPRVHFLGDPYGLTAKKVQWAFVRRVGGYIPVDKCERSGPRLYRHVDSCLQRGGIVALYPEGHYGATEGRVDDFKEGFAHFAIKNGVPLIPVGISGSKDLWLRKKILVFIEEAIYPEGYDVESRVSEGRARLQALLPEYRDPRGPRLFQNWLTNLF